MNVFALLDKSVEGKPCLLANLRKARRNESVLRLGTTVVWEKFTVGYFRVKIVHGKIFSSHRVSDGKFLTAKYFKVKLFVPLLKNLMHNYIKSCTVHFAQAQTHNDNRV